jgi:hypothetical protein
MAATANVNSVWKRSTEVVREPRAEHGRSPCPVTGADVFSELSLVVVALMGLQQVGKR